MRLLPVMLLMFLALPLARAHTLPTARQDLVVIVNPAAHVAHMTRSQVIDIFMGRLRQLPTGAPALPIDLADGTVRSQFYRHLVHWSLAQVSSYWARLVFSGQASPPFRVQSARAAVKLVADNPDAIAYVPSTAITPRVRVVLDLSPP